MADARLDQLDVHFLSRLLTFVPETDLTLIVLKGHLLIEEQLIALVERNLKQPSAIKKFSLANRYSLAKAMYYEKENDSIWRSLKILNNLRNHLSHDLEANELERKAKEFLDSVEDAKLLASLIPGRPLLDGLDGSTYAVCIALAVWHA